MTVTRHKAEKSLKTLRRSQRWKTTNADVWHIFLQIAEKYLKKSKRKWYGTLKVKKPYDILISAVGNFELKPVSESQFDNLVEDGGEFDDDISNKILYNFDNILLENKDKCVF